MGLIFTAANHRSNQAILKSFKQNNCFGPPVRKTPFSIYWELEEPKPPKSAFVN